VLEAPYPELDDLLEMMGEVGQRLSDIDASEGAAGNISICIRWPLELRNRFPHVGTIELPQAVPELAGATFLVSGSGRRLREIIDEPTASMACVVVDASGQTGTLHQASSAGFSRSPASSTPTWPCITTRCAPVGPTSMR
jgi:rhamnulose-1-phosphate aldolase